MLKKFDWKSILSISAVITSLCALYVSFNQLKIASAEQQASVFPYLTAASTSNEKRIEMYLNNDGTGPAFISGVEVRLGDSVYQNFWRPVEEFVENKNIDRGTAEKPTFVKSDLLPGWVVRPNSERYTLFVLDNLKGNQANEFWQYFSDKDKGIQAKIWYLDLYNNCWLFDYNKVTVSRCAKCPSEVLHR